MSNVIYIRGRQKQPPQPVDLEYKAFNTYERRIKLARSLYQDDPADFKDLVEEIRTWLSSKHTDETRRLLLLGVCIDYVATTDRAIPSLFVIERLQYLARLYGVP